MSEEIQGNNDRQQHTIASDTFQEEPPEEAPTPQSTERSSSSTLRAATPRAGALLVEAYGKLVGKQAKTLSPDKVLFEYAKGLVSFLIRKSLFLFLLLYTDGSSHKMFRLANSCVITLQHITQVSSIGDDDKTDKSAKEALGLLSSVELALKGRGLRTWGRSFLQTVADILETHPVSCIDTLIRGRIVDS